MKAAIIDLGTNTFHLIIAETTHGDILYKVNLPVKLGEGRINENIIIPEAFKRGIDALKSFKEQIDIHGVSTIKAIATSAVRSASNGADFVEAALQEAAIEITVVDGDEEAGFIYNGVKATGILSGVSLIMDIGGGSTEFIICTKDEILWKKSYNIGAARLQQAYFNSDPINLRDQSAIKQRLALELTDLFDACELHKPKQLVGSAGAFETFAGMIATDLDVKKIRSTGIDLSAYHKLSDKLINSTHAERKNFDGLIPLRVDMIVIASLITNYILEMTHIKQLSLSTYDLKMGVLFTLQNSDT
ncbi:Ppx/GppA phosphatase family protein [Pedobacter sp. PWIIR3]